MKVEMKGKDKCKFKVDLCCKSLISVERVSEYIFKESFIMWNN